MPVPQTPPDDFVLDVENGNEFVPGTERPEPRLEDPNYWTWWEGGPGQVKRELIVDGPDRENLTLYDSQGVVVWDLSLEDLSDLPEHAAERFRDAVVRALRDLLDEIDPLA